MYHLCERDGDYDRLIDIWERAVRATHHFLPEEKIRFYRDAIPRVYFPQVQMILACDDKEIPVAFMGLVPLQQSDCTKVGMLFVEPALQGKGIGRSLLRWAWERYGTLELDVNEQNPGATAFYEKCGFIRIGRSAFDDEGNPFPLLHMRREVD